MKRKKCSALLKGSLVLAAVLFMESSGVSGLGQQLAIKNMENTEPLT